MGAFIIAGVVFVLTLVACVIILWGASMKPAPSADDTAPAKATFIGGTALSLLIAASHWLPHIGW
jgi:hypothetical protein